MVNKIAAFIDGSNAFATAKALNKDIDYKKLRTFFEKKGDLLRVYYYTAVLPAEQESTLRPLVDWLSYNGYEVVTKDTKEFVDPFTGRRKVKGNMDIELAVDVMELAPGLSDVYIFSGDGDFEYLVRALQRRSVRVHVISSIKTAPAMCADDLRRVADSFTDLSDLQEVLRAPPERRSYANG